MRAAKGDPHGDCFCRVCSVERASVFAAAGQEPVQMLGVFRPDAGQARGCREERVEERGAHRSRDLFLAVVPVRARQRKEDRGGAAIGGISMPKERV
jgi:hypothetical protein